MKKLSPCFKKQVIAAITMLLLLSACYEFDFVTQPGSVDPNSSFTVNISITTNDGDGGEYTPYFGIKIPDGWTVEDNVPFTLNSVSGTFEYSANLSEEMETFDPADPGYYWWVGAGTDPVIYNYEDTYLIDPVIQTNDQSGTFYLDYMAGSDAYDYGGMNWSRSNDHLITVGLPDQLVVTSIADSGPGSLREAIEGIDFYGTITFDLPGENTIVLGDELKIFKDISIIGSEDDPVTISGGDAHRVFYIGQAISPQLANLVITNGQSPNGAGIFCELESTPVFENLVISHCSASTGGGIYMTNSSPVLNQVVITLNDATNSGGGIYMYGDSYPVLTDVVISKNGASYGGGLYCGYYSSPELHHVSIFMNTAENSGGGMYCDYDTYPVFDEDNRCNIYLNDAIFGTDLNSGQFLSVVLDTFTVATPSEFFAYPLENFEFDILNGMIEQANADLYVAPNGDNTNSGLTPDEPLKTIGFAQLKMLASESDPQTVHLLEGTYSPSTNGESYPLIMRNYVNLQGTAEMDVVLDAENQSKVLAFYDISVCEVKSLTITGGLDEYGGGIYCSNSSPSFSNLVITGNKATTNGAGIYLGNYSNPALSNVQISHNIAYKNGGGIYFNYSNAPIFDDQNRCNIYMNMAARGQDLYSSSYSEMNIVVDTFTVLTPNIYHAYPLEYFQFDILNGKVEQVNADLYVSPQGDNSNSGLSAEEPLKNINFAYSKLLNSSINPVTVHLLEGTYSPSGNNDLFPILMLDYVSLSGTSPEEVILDAEQIGNVVEIANTQDSDLSNLSITGGYTNYGNGGGIYIYNSTSVMENLHIYNNSSGYGGGIYCESSDLYLKDIDIINNTAMDYGGGIYIYSGNTVLDEVRMQNNTAYYGGAMYIYNSSPELRKVSMVNNSAYRAGGIYCGNYSNPVLRDVSIHHNSATQYAGGMYIRYNSSPLFDSLNRCNIYLNEADDGSDLYSDNIVEIVVDTFTVMYPKYYHAYPLSNFTFDILHGVIPQVAADLYVSPEGDDSSTGITPEEPLKTIRHALIKIVEDSLNLYTIHLDEGTYSPSTNGEEFPLIMSEYVNMSGSSPSEVIIDAEQTNTVIRIQDIVDISISNLTIQGGSNYSGGGIFCSNASPVLENLVITNNISSGYGGGIFCDYNASPILQDVVILNNSAQYGGGGLYAPYNCNPSLTNVKLINNSSQYGGAIYSTDGNLALNDVNISENQASYSGGGIYFGYNSSASLTNVSIYSNESEYGGGIYNDNAVITFDTEDRSNIYLNTAVYGNDLFSYNFLEVVVDTFTVLYPTEFFAQPFENFSFDILNGKVEQIDGDVYVSPEGDDENSGISTDDPLKTIYSAISRIMADSINQNTIYLLEGTYGPSSNGENFPLSLPDYVSISGMSQQKVILHGEDQSGVLHIDDNVGSTVSNLTITHGYSQEGGAIYIWQSSPELTNLTIMNNTAYYYGGGISINYNSNPVLSNITLTKNKAEYGGGMYCSSSSPTLQDVKIRNNEGEYQGGGIYCYNYSEPELINVIITLNTSQQGGGMYCGYNSNAIFNGVNVEKNQASEGGGIYCDDYSDIQLINTDISFNDAETSGGGIYCGNNSNPVFDLVDRSNVFFNTAVSGMDLYAESFVSVVVDTFTVLYPTKFYADPLENFEFDILHGLIDQIEADLYVSPAGDNANSGLTPESPLQTIHNAYSKILASSTQPRTIHLLDGTYSPYTNNEYFPINTLDFVKLSGSSPEAVILDGAGQTGVLEIQNTEGVEVSNLTITGGQAYSGAGIYCSGSSPVLSDLLIQNNAAQYDGGGILCDNGSAPILENISLLWNTASTGGGVCIYDDSYPTFLNTRITNNTVQNYGGGLFLGYNTNAQLISVLVNHNKSLYNGGGIFCESNSDSELVNVTLENNAASYSGGGIYMEYCDISLEDVRILYNSANTGGGIFSSNTYPGFDTLNRSSIYLNYAEEGSDIYSYNEMEVIVDTFTVMLPKSHQAAPLPNYTFDILHGLYPQFQKNLYVSPTGDNSNNGQNPTMPLKTITHAFSMISADSLNLYDVHLLNGTYSSSSNGESFPIWLDDYINLIGESAEGTILDANGTETILNVENRRDVGISHLTLTGGSAYNGGAMYIYQSDPVIEDLVFQNNSANYGGAIYCINASPVIIQSQINDNIATYSGGGIYCDQSPFLSLQQVEFSNNQADVGAGLSLYNSQPELKEVDFTGNNATYSGGAIYSYNSTVNLKSTNITNNSAEQMGGGIFNDIYSAIIYDSLDRCNIYLNSAVLGSDLYTEGFMDVIVDTFTVLYPKPYHTYPLQNFTFDILNGMLPQVHADLYVSPEGNNSNTGLTPEDPMKTIVHALSVIAEDSVNIYTINLLDGVYSPSTNGENFPLYMVDYVSLEGSSIENVTLDAEGMGTVMNLNTVFAAEVSNLSITGGNGENFGGGIYCNNAKPYLHDLHIFDNYATDGGGIYFDDYSDAILEEVYIFDNQAINGGGIYCDDYSSPTIKNTLISENSANDGGGIFCRDHSNPWLKNTQLIQNVADNDGGGLYCINIAMPYLQGSRIVYNQSASKGGGIYSNVNSKPEFDSNERSNIYMNSASLGSELYSDNDMIVVVDTFTVLYPKSYHAYPLYNFSFDILYGLIPQVAADLYVSPDGDNANSGLNAEDPLKNINFALSVIAEDSLSLYTIHLADGVYSPSSTGETYPLYIPEYIGLKGESEEGTILDAEQSSIVLHFVYSHQVEVSNLTITGGYNDSGYGGGIYMLNSDPMMYNLTIDSNYATYGGGVFLKMSSPSMINVNINNNSSQYGGGGICCYEESSPLLDTAEISFNTAGSYGGGLYCTGKSSPIIKNASIHNNAASTGAGIYLGNKSNAVMDRVEVVQNAAEHSGGGIYAPYSSPILNHVRIANNTSTGKGGGIYLSGSTSILVNTEILNNTAEEGGGLYFSASDPILVNLVVTGNVVTESGGGMYLSVTNPLIANLTIAGNSALEGGGIFSYKSDMEVFNTILWNAVEEVFFKASGGPSNISLHYSDIQEGEDGIVTNENGTVEFSETNIEDDPLFEMGDIHPYQLSAGSPCIDAGSPDVTGLFLPVEDILWNKRIWDAGIGNAVVDIGAYEFGSIAVGTEEAVVHSSGLNVQCFPNPITDLVTFQFETIKSCRVTIEIFDINGNKVQDLANELPISGKEKLTFNLASLNKGIYLVKIRTGNEIVTRKLVKTM